MSEWHVRGSVWCGVHASFYRWTRWTRVTWLSDIPFSGTPHICGSHRFMFLSTDKHVGQCHFQVAQGVLQATWIPVMMVSDGQSIRKVLCTESHLYVLIDNDLVIYRLSSLNTAEAPFYLNTSPLLVDLQLPSPEVPSHIPDLTILTEESCTLYLVVACDLHHCHIIKATHDAHGRWCHQTLLTPQLLPNEKVTDIAGGGRHLLMRTSSGRLFTVGWNAHGQLGHGTATSSSSSSFSVVDSLEGAVLIAKMSAGLWHSVVLCTATNDVYTCGWPQHGLLGRPIESTTVSQPALFEPLPDDLFLHPLVDICCGDAHTVVYDHQNNVYGWGNNDFSELSSQSVSELPAPTFLGKFPGLQRCVAFGWTTVLWTDCNTSS